MTTTDAKEVYIAFDQERCTQCFGCQTACKTWIGLPYGVLNRRVINLWQGQYPNIKSGSLSLSCLHCVTPACAEVCPVEAIEKRSEDGLVQVNGELCIGCRSCADACQYGIPQFTEDDTMIKCDLCLDLEQLESPPCVATCPGEALSVIYSTSSEKLLHEKSILNLLQQPLS